eukprot:Nk52_evm47s1020 gene=Nk52_evmTU47s1020
MERESDVEYVRGAARVGKELTESETDKGDKIVNLYRKCGKPVSLAECHMIVNVFRNLEKEAGVSVGSSQDRAQQKIFERCAKYCGLSKSTVVAIIKDYRAKPNAVNFRTSVLSHKERDNRSAFSGVGKALIEESISDVKDYIRTRLSEGVQVTCNDIYGYLTEKYTSFPFSQRTVRRFVLNRMGFTSEQFGFKTCVVEKPKYVEWRARFLQTMEENGDGLIKIYCGEAIVSGEKGKAVRVEGKDNENDKPGKRSKVWQATFMLAGGEFGSVPDSLECVRAIKSKVDRYVGLQPREYEKWFEAQLLPSLKKLEATKKRKFLIILDNAPYHKRRINFSPEESTVPELRQFCKEHRIPVEVFWTRKTLVKEVKKFILTMPCCVEKVATKAGYKVAFLPPYDHELNPVSKITALMKEKLGLGSEKSVDLENVVSKCEEYLGKNADAWRKAVKECASKRSHMRELDALIRSQEEEYVGSRERANDYSGSEKSDSEDDGKNEQSDRYRVHSEIVNDSLKADGGKRTKKKRRVQSNSTSGRDNPSAGEEEPQTCHIQ